MGTSEANVWPSRRASQILSEHLGRPTRRRYLGSNLNHWPKSDPRPLIGDRRERRQVMYGLQEVGTKAKFLKLLKNGFRSIR